MRTRWGVREVPAPTRRGLTNGLTRDVPRGVGRTNGLVNGVRGRTNGLVNGTHGHTNGLVNGTRGRTNGIVNGTRSRTGFVNGSGFVNGLPLRLNPFGIVTHRDLRRGVALVVIAFIAVPTVAFLLMAPPDQPPRYAVDGTFEEWAPDVAFDEQDAPPSLDLEAVAVHVEGDTVYAYGRTRGPLFAGTEPSSVFLLIDDPRPTGTRYAAARGFSVLAIAELFGWDGALQGTRLRAWAGGADVHDANGFRRGGDFPAEAAGPEIEFSVDLASVGIADNRTVRLRLTTQGEAGTDLGPILGSTTGALIVRQESLATSISGVTNVLRLTAYAAGVPVRVQDLTFVQTGGASAVLPSFPILIPAGATQPIHIGLDPGALPSGTLLGFEVLDVEAVDEKGIPVLVTLTGDGARLYVRDAPQGRAIDGLFDDWRNESADLDEGLPGSAEILATESAIESGAFLYVRTEGGVLAGALFPVRPSKPVPGGNASSSPGPVPLPRIAGEDVFRAYVDTDDQDPAGLPFAGVVADRLVEIRGRFGRVTEKVLSAWDPQRGGWSPQAQPLDVALVGTELEAFLLSAFLGPTRNATLVFAMSDWSGASDLSEPSGLRGTRSGPGVRPLDGTNPQTIVATLLTNIPNVDGDCTTTSGEYDGASSDSPTGFTFWIGRRDELEYVYVCIETTDTSENILDWGELLFDTDHDDQDPPQAEDRRFRKFASATPMVPEMGDGSGWTPCGTSCDSGDSADRGFADGFEVYEFRIRYSDVWGTNTPEPNDRAGFAIVVHDEDTTTDYIWGADNVDENAPSTWGRLDIPEFPLLAAFVVVAIPFAVSRLRRSRRGSTA